MKTCGTQNHNFQVTTTYNLFATDFEAFVSSFKLFGHAYQTCQQPSETLLLWQITLPSGCNLFGFLTFYICIWFFNKLQQKLKPKYLKPLLEVSWLTAQTWTTSKHALRNMLEPQRGINTRLQWRLVQLLSGNLHSVVRSIVSKRYVFYNCAGLY